MSNETLKTAHAPGPWETEVLGNTLRVIDFDGNDIVLIGNCMDERKQANARLISAAPTLLKACKAALNLSDKVFSEGSYDERSPECQAVYDKVLAAIKRATE